MGETMHDVEVDSNGNVSFSILKRIVMGETSRSAVENPDYSIFQYPQADRDG